jgi:hypothetical protein
MDRRDAFATIQKEFPGLTYEMVSKFRLKRLSDPKLQDLSSKISQQWRAIWVDEAGAFMAKALRKLCEKVDDDMLSNAQLVDAIQTIAEVLSENTLVSMTGMRLSRGMLQPASVASEGFNDILQDENTIDISIENLEQFELTHLADGYESISEEVAAPN